MPRDSGGTYTLPASNPVISGTIIESSWANSTMGDIGNEMTDSLSRTGNGAMLAPFRAVDGTAGAPSLTFVNEPSMGRARTSAGVMVDSINGLAVAEYTATGITFSQPVTLDPIIAGDLSLLGNVRLVNNKEISGLNVAGDTNITLASVDTNNAVALGSLAAPTNINGAAAIAFNLASGNQIGLSDVLFDVIPPIHTWGDLTADGNLYCYQAVAEAGYVLRKTNNVAYAALYQSANTTHVGTPSVATNITGVSVSLVHGDGSLSLYTESGGAVVPNLLKCGSLLLNGTLVHDFVISSGSNSNGYFLLWNSGLKECWARLDSTNAAGTWTFPLVFNSPSTMEITATCYVNGTSTAAIWVKTFSTSSMTYSQSLAASKFIRVRGY